MKICTTSVVSNILTPVPSKKEKLPLSVTHPELAKEAFGWDPREFSSKSGIKQEWKCPSGHIYQSLISNRANGSNCPVCIGRLILPGFNDLATTHPEIAQELVDEDATKISKGTKKKLIWRCGANHIFSATVYNRTAGYGCPYCSGNKVLPGFNDLLTTHPEIASELVGEDSTKISRGSRRRLLWKCALEHTYTNSVSARTSQGQNCPFCSGKQILRGFNDLATTHPQLADQVFEGNAKQVTRGSKKEIVWICALGHKYKLSVNQRTSQNRGCPYCSGKRVLPGFNDLATTHPDLILELIDGDPLTISRGSNKRFKWECGLGHQYSSSPAIRTAGHGCPICSGSQILEGFNDLLTTHPKIASELIDTDPKTVSKGMSTKVLWRCKLGHKYTAGVRSRIAGQSCPYCAGKQVLPGFNDLATTHPRVAGELTEADATRISKGSVKKYRWKCELGHFWIATPNSRTSRDEGSGCPSCTVSGFDPNKVAWLYLLTHDDWEMLQIGITNHPDDRLHSHELLGWRVCELRGPMDGHLTQRWETAILRMLKAKGADLSNGKIAGKFDGYSEAWSKSKFKVNSIRELMSLVDEFESISKEAD